MKFLEELLNALKKPQGPAPSMATPPFLPPGQAPAPHPPLASAQNPAPQRFDFAQSQFPTVPLNEVTVPQREKIGIDQILPEVQAQGREVNAEDELMLPRWQAENMSQPWYKDKDTMEDLGARLSQAFGGLTMRGNSAAETAANMKRMQGAAANKQKNKTMDYLIKNNPEMAKVLMNVPEEYRGDYMKLAMQNSMGGLSGMTDSVKSKVQLANILGYKPGSDDYEAFLSGNKSDSALSAELRKEFNSNADVKYFADMTQSFNRLVNSVGPDPASDMALIFNYMKMLDPGSTVREGEYATARQTTGLPGRVTNLYNYVVEGNQLNAEQRRAFFEKGKAIYEGAVSDYNVLRDQYTSLPNSDQLIDHRREFSFDGLDYGDGPAPLNERIVSAKNKMGGMTASRLENYLDEMRDADPELFQALGLE